MRIRVIDTGLRGGRENVAFDQALIEARNAGRVMSRERIMDLVRGETLEAFDRSIDVHVAKIRQAIEDDPHGLRIPATSVERERAHVPVQPRDERVAEDVGRADEIDRARRGASS